MSLFTSTSGCDSCLRMTQKIAGLEGRISTLFQIRDEGRILDSVITMGPVATTMGPTVTTTTSGELDSPLLRLQTTGLSRELSPRPWLVPLLARRSYRWLPIRVKMLGSSSLCVQFSPHPATLSVCSVNPSGHQSMLVVTPSEPAGGHVAPRAVITSFRFKPPLHTPTSLIVCDSVVRHIESKTAVTHCLPGATIVDIMF